MVSVCLATYNGGKYLRPQVDSILSQLDKNDELIVSNDGSNDDTIAILKSYNDHRIKIFFNSKDHGVINNFENALCHATGDYIFLSDQDDVWLPNKVEICLNSLKESDCIIHDCFITDENLTVISNSLFKELDAGLGFLKNLKKNTFTGCCMAFSKKVMEKTLPFPKSSLFYHDQWIGLISLLSFNTVFLHTPLVFFRRHSTTTSSAGSQSKFNFKEKLFSRFAISKALLKRYLSN